MSKKIAVVTSLIGAYDSNLLEFEYDRSKYEFICYTNMTRLRSNTWTIRHVDELQVPNNNAKSSYYYKWQAHKLLSTDTYSSMIWVDSSFTSINMNEIDAMVEEFRASDKSLYIEKHPSNNTLMAELELNSTLNKDDINAMRSQVQRYFDDGFREDYAHMVETGLSFRKLDDPQLNAVCDTIWNEIKPDGNTKRDQLIYDYAVWKNQFTNFAFFSFERKLKTILFQDHPHKSTYTEKVLLIGPWFGEAKYEPMWAKFAERYTNKTPVDNIIVGCRSGSEHLYKNINPDRIITTDPDGVMSGKLLDGRVPRFNPTANRDKTLIELHADHEDFIDVEKQIHIVWATIRADAFDEKYTAWIDKCDIPENIIPHIGVDTEEDKAKITCVDPKYIAVNPPPRKGVTYPGYMLTSKIESDNDQDIVIFASDDFVPTDRWDAYLYQEFTDYDGSLLVNDKCEPIIKDIMTIPIMTYHTLCKLNKIVYHPAYAHCWSDNELLFNLEEMKLIKDLRLSKPHVWFEHEHYVNGGREHDESDKALGLTNHTGKSLWEVRKQLPLEERLKYNEDEHILSILILTLEERADKLAALKSILEPQLNDNVELVIVCDNREDTVGKKRNMALEQANGRYICFIDDDDTVSDTYVDDILNIVSCNDVDCCSLTGNIDLNEYPRGTFIHSLKYTEWGEKIISGEGMNSVIEYYRPPNHLNVVRRDIAKFVGFNDNMSVGEDRDYSIRLRNHLTSEASINNVLYYYDAKSDK